MVGDRTMTVVVTPFVAGLGSSTLVRMAVPAVDWRLWAQLLRRPKTFPLSVDGNRTPRRDFPKAFPTDVSRPKQKSLLPLLSRYSSLLPWRSVAGHTADLTCVILAVAESPPMMMLRKGKGPHCDIDHRRGCRPNERRRICVSTKEIQLASLRCISIVGRDQQDQT
jgi:hypothetical protein